MAMAAVLNVVTPVEEQSGVRPFTRQARYEFNIGARPAASKSVNAILASVVNTRMVAVTGAIEVHMHVAVEPIVALISNVASGTMTG